MRLHRGDKYIPGNRPWYKIPRGDDIVIYQSEGDFELARFSRELKMEEIAKNNYNESVYIIK
jgi:hypothetical protein